MLKAFWHAKRYGIIEKKKIIVIGNFKVVLLLDLDKYSLSKETLMGTTWIKFILLKSQILLMIKV